MSRLSDRIRPGVEAAPWVCDEVKKIEAVLDRLIGVAELAAEINPFGSVENAAARDAARAAIAKTTGSAA